MKASSLVLMEREDGVLTNELGSYEISAGINFVFKAYVEYEEVHLFLTTEKDVTDGEYNAIFDNYNMDFYEEKGYGIEEIEDEYNPVWCVKFDYNQEYSIMESILNEILAFHEAEINRISNLV